MEIILPQLFHVIKVVLQMVAVQFKQKKHILIAFIFVNIFAGLGYILLGAYTGLLTCGIAVIQTIIQYIFDKKQKEVPKYFSIIYLVSSIIGGFFTYKTFIDILPLLSFVMYTLSILPKKESTVRKFTLLKLLLWIPYDAFNFAFASMIGRIITVISTIVGMIRLDIKKEKVDLDKIEWKNND